MALTTRLSRYLDALVSPEMRTHIVQQLLAFALARPYLASYLAIFLFFAFLPLLGLLVFVVTLAALLATTIIFWISLALVVTSGFLLVSATLATCAYVYLVGVFLAARWAKRVVMPASREEKRREEADMVVRQRHWPKNRAEGVKKEGKEDGGVKTPGIALNNGAEAVKSDDEEEPKEEVVVLMGEGNGVAEAKMRQKMKRDIAKSLQ